MSYLESHPWLTFSIPVERAPARLWLLLGEAASKCLHIAGVPLKPETARELLKIYLAKGALATTAIEGNTLSEPEALQLVEGTLELPPSRQYLAREVQNIIDASNEIVRKVEAGDSPLLGPATLMEFNRVVLQGLDLAEGVVPGRVRDHDVGVARYKGAPPQDLEYLLRRLCDWLNQGFDIPKDRPESRLPLAIIKAIVAHVYIAWIHPFGDGNGRTARLVELQILFSSRVPMPAAHLLSNHYNQTRSEYYRQLERASASGGDLLPFLVYAVGGLVDGLKGQLDHIRDQQWGVAWENYVHDQFKNMNGASDQRKKHLVLDLSHQGSPVPRQKLRELSPRLAKAYAGRTEMTLTRDINSLLGMDLIRRDGDGWVARREKILAFLPPGGLRAMNDEPEAQVALRL